MSKSYFKVGVSDYATTRDDEAVLAVNGDWHVGARFPVRAATARALSNDLDLLFRAINGRVDDNGPQHVLVGGKGAGAGKSYLLGEFKRVYEQEHEALSPGDPTLVVTAPTGLAAQLVGGQTIHSALGLGLASKGAKTHWAELQRMSPKTRTTNRTWRFLQLTKVLVIDEISMVDPELIGVIDYLFQKARRSNLPFGGITVVMFGDFLQLPPVNKQDRPAESARYIFQTTVWQCMNVCRLKLNRNYRQKDASFIQLLEEVRFGEISEQSLALLRSRLVQNVKRAEPQIARDESAPPPYEEVQGAPHNAKRQREEEAEGPSKCARTDNIEPLTIFPKRQREEEAEGPSKSARTEETRQAYKIEPLTIFPKTNTVNAKNHSRLMELGKTNLVEKFKPAYGYCAHREDRAPSHADIAVAQRFYGDPNKMEKTFPVLELSCCIGAQVMLRCNSYKDLGLVNGSMGIVVSILQDKISVLFTNLSGQFLDQPTPIARHLFRHNVSETADVTVRQFPLSLSWAMTIHKVQGMTLKNLEIAGADCFETGQFYVAISRAPTLEDFTLLNFDPHSVRVDKEAAYFERQEEEDDPL